MSPPAEETVAEVAPEVPEPATKKAKGDDGEAVAKTGWESYTMNIAEAVVVESEGAHLTTIADGPVSALQGIGPKASSVAEVLGINTVRELAEYKYFKMARAIVTLETCEVEGKRPEGSVMNIDKAVDTEYEGKSLKEIATAPTAALQGISPESGALLSELGATTVAELGTFKYALWAESICHLASLEHTKTSAERTQEAMLKRLE